MANELLTKSVDLIWDNWLNSVKTINTVQEDIEKRTIEALNAQKTTFNTALNTFKAAEVKTNEALQQWQNQLLTSFESVATPAQTEQLSTWFTTLKQVTQQTQELTAKPTKIASEYIEKAQTEWDKTVAASVKAQKAERDKALKNIEQLTAKLKEDQKSLLTKLPQAPAAK
ncbi:hypothetical protein [Kurthia senegalensis]|uniref:hypothetical protein n=1 Tax=Kurthia senegalensis TaxID=1033740 RepID=UPI0002893BC4|nr:hypothetical protein [Kurthia senegalensis]